MTRLIPLFCALLLLPVLAFAQPASTPTKDKVVEVTKAPAAKVVVSPATQMAHVVVPPASQPAVAQVAPASQPATVKPAWRVWLADNWLWILFVVLIPSLINGLKKKGVRQGIIGFLESLVDRSSVTTNKDSYGTFKPPFVASKKPPQK